MEVMCVPLIPKFHQKRPNTKITMIFAVLGNPFSQNFRKIGVNKFFHVKQVPLHFGAKQTSPRWSPYPKILFEFIWFRNVPEPTKQLLVYRTTAPQYVSDAGVQVSPAPAAPPAPTMEDLLRMQKLKAREIATPTIEPVSPLPTRRPALEVSRRRENPALVGELSETLSRNQGEVLRPATRGAVRVAINEKSSPEDVTRWLQEKGFSPRVIDLLDGQDGANLFSLQKLHLQQACGRDEGSYLYSQLLVQKNRSGYRTHTGDELKAILNQRKTHVELSNETPADEPTFAINH